MGEAAVPPRAAQPDRASAALAIYLLGRFEVVRGDDPIPHASWRRRRPADLLKLVALSPGRALVRERAIDALWPEKDAASGANNLHRALYDLRSILGGRWVDLDRGVVRLREDAWVDVDAFEAAAAAVWPDAQAAAVSLYAGDLAPEDAHAPWLTRRRDELRARFASAALHLARAAAARGDTSTALPLLRRICACDAAGEEANVLLARLLAASGHRGDALRQLDACEAALRGRGAVPGAARLALRAAVQRGEVALAPGRAAQDGYRRAARRLLGAAEPAPLRGRGSGLVLLEALVQARGGALVLLGERGVGKTRLAVEGARLAQAAGAEVLAGTFDPERPIPFAGFHEALAARARAGAADDPFRARSARRSWPDSERGAVFEAVRSAILAAGSGRPVYLLLDDFHSIDESSADLFHFLARGARADELMLVATCREDAVRAGTAVQALLARLDRDGLARGARVERLDLAGTREQLGDLLGTAPSDALAARIHRFTDGNPHHTEELGRAFRESGQVLAPGDPAAAARERVARLGPQAVALLEVAAVMGRRFELEVIRSASGLTAHEALAALEKALEAHVVAEEGGGHRFRHALAREALVAALPSARRAALHRAIGAALEARARAAGDDGGPALDAALAHHHAAGGEPARAFAHLVAAGRGAAGRCGMAEASAFYARALELAEATGVPPAARFELLEALGAASLAQGELPSALRAFQAAAAVRAGAEWRPAPPARARALRGAALALLAGGRRSEARERLEAALDLGGEGMDGERAEAARLLARIACRAGDGGAAAADAAERDLDAPFDVELALWQHDLARGRPLAELAAEVAAFAERARLHGASERTGVARALEGAIAALAGRGEAAEAALRDAAERLRAAGSAQALSFALERLASLLTDQGRVAEAFEILGEAVAAAGRAALRCHALVRCHATLARNRLAAGAHRAAEDALSETRALLLRHGPCAACEALLGPERAGEARAPPVAAGAPARS